MALAFRSTTCACALCRWIVLDPPGVCVARYLKAVGDPREVVSDPEARYFWGSGYRKNSKN